MPGMPFPLGKAVLSPAELKKDKRECRKFGPCGAGVRALYLNSFYIPRMYYVPIASITRIYKRVAMSKGGFTGKGLFASIPYLVVEFEGREKQCNFRVEEQVDQLVAFFHERHPQIPIHSERAEQRLLDRERRLAERRKKLASTPASGAIGELREAEAYLEKRPELYRRLSESARRKRADDRSNPAYRWVAAAVMLLGACSLAYGIFSLLRRDGAAMYFLLFGLAALFLFSGANVLPTRRNNRAFIRQQLADASTDMETYVGGFADFPVPARYAHPVVLRWMALILAEERAKDVPGALETLKSDLRALNADVSVDEEVYEDVLAIKPLFLVCDYR